MFARRLPSASSPKSVEERASLCQTEEGRAGSHRTKWETAKASTGRSLIISTLPLNYESQVGPLSIQRHSRPSIDNRLHRPLRHC